MPILLMVLVRSTHVVEGSVNLKVVYQRLEKYICKIDCFIRFRLRSGGLNIHLGIKSQ